MEELRRQQIQIQRKISALVDSLAEFGHSEAQIHVTERIEELHARNAQLQVQIVEQESKGKRNSLREEEFQRVLHTLAGFGTSVGIMTVEQKRAAIRTFVKEIIWDGRDAHVVLFGSEYEYEFPKTPAGIGKQVAGSKTEENLEGAAEGGLAEPSGEDSK